LDNKAEGFKESYFGQLAQLEARNFWFQARSGLITWALARHFPKARSFLEIGCGTGFVLSSIAQAFPHLRLCGTEIYTTGLRYARERLESADLLQTDARRIPFTGEFDVIGAFDVLEHIEDDETVLLEMHRAIRPGGGIILTVPQHAFLWSRQDEYACHVRRYEASELAAKTRAAGFSLVRSTSFVALLMPLMLISRWRKRMRGQDFDPLNELRVGTAFNAALAHVMNFELAMIRSGANFPFGGSRLILGRK
jgi:SAM-dependent methyltransferase